MRVSNFSDKSTVRDFLKEFEGDFEELCKKYGLQYVRTNARFSSTMLDLRYELRIIDHPFSDVELRESDILAAANGVEYSEHFIGSKYKLLFRGVTTIFTVVGVNPKARKYRVQAKSDSGIAISIPFEYLRGRLVKDSDERPSTDEPLVIDKIITYVSHTYEDDRMSDQEVNDWDMVDSMVAKAAPYDEHPSFYSLLDDVANHTDSMSITTLRKVAMKVQSLINGLTDINEVEMDIKNICGL